MKNLLVILLICVSFFSCEGTNDTDINLLDQNDGIVENILMLKVDYTSNQFKGGVEHGFETTAANFTVVSQFQTNGDFANLKLFYDEQNFKLFDGDIFWMGTGALLFPEPIDPASDFEYTLTEDYIYPSEGFENVYSPIDIEYDINEVWSSVQSLIKVREYLHENPNSKVKFFLYQPSVGVGNPADWCWILFLKK